MKRAAIAWAITLALAFSVYVVNGQPPAGSQERAGDRRGASPDEDRPNDGRRGDRRQRGTAQSAPAKSGVVTEFTKNPDGETDGLRLDDGTEVRFRPESGEKVTRGVSLKDRVTIEGWTHSGEPGIHAATIKNEASGKVLVVDRAPPEISQGGAGSRRGGPGGPGGERSAGGRRGDDQDRPPPSARKRGSSLVLSSPAVTDGAALPKEFTGDGEGVSPPLEWSGAPAGTRSYALIMHHTDARRKNISYWVLYNIPADVHNLPKGVQGVGSLGVSSRSDHAGYVPPHSKGPGARTYIFTLYALSAPPPLDVSSAEVTAEALLAAMKDKILDSADLSVSHTRYTLADGSPPRDEDRRPARDERH